DGRAAEEARNGGKRRAGARHPALTFNRSDKGGLLAADEGARTFFNLDIEAEVGTQYAFAEQRAFTHLPEGVIQPLYGEGIFRANVNDALARTYGIARDQHTFEHRVGVRFDERSVHKCARVTLVGIADQIFLLARRTPAKRPLLKGREARSS